MNILVNLKEKRIKLTLNYFPTVTYSTNLYKLIRILYILYTYLAHLTPSL